MEEPKITPPMPPQHPPHVLAKMERRRKLRKKLLRIVPVAALVLAVALGIWLGVSAGKDDNAEPWEENILRSDEVPRKADGTSTVYPMEYTVLGSDYQRQQIRSVTFLDTLADMPEDAWDVSEAGNGSVMAWVKPDGHLYDLYIAGEGGVRAGTSCKFLFAGYKNMTQITFCDNFDTANVQDMAYMFCSCSSLTSLDLGDKFVTTNAFTYDMFDDCPAGANYQHLLNN